MAEFLSSGWMRDVESAGSSVKPSAEIRILFQVTGRRDGDLTWLVELGVAGLSVHPVEPTSPCDLSIRLPHDAALELAQGRLRLHEAVLAGRIKVAGDLGRLQAAGTALAEIAAAVAGVADRTSFGDSSPAR